MSGISMLTGEIISDSERRHRAHAIDYWDTLRHIVEWWETLPPNLRQDIEGSGADPSCIARAKKFVRPWSV